MMSDDEGKKTSRLLKDAYSVQRMRLEKLMKNPTKPVVIPDRPKEKKPLYVPDFVRNVMGSSAGAGSGEFHVYRHLRRKEYSRQKLIAEHSEKEKLDIEFQEKLLKNQKKTEERTSIKRAKRRKKKAKRKEKLKLKKLKVDDKNSEKNENSSNSGNESSDDQSAGEKKNDES